MSRKATNEYIGTRRRAYAEATLRRRKAILDDVCDTTGYSRKYANRLLTGSRKFKERKGRGPTYTARDKSALERIWREVGCPCTSYVKANVEEWLEEYRTCVAHVFDVVVTHLLSMRRIPFEVWSVHHDNGKEYVNNAIAEWRGDRWKMPFSRSRPYRKNDNAHVEQKNGSVVRILLGESRLDRSELEPELRRLCEDYSGYRNFCVPCKMLVAKTKRKDGKGFSCRYDKPRTPYARVLADPAVPEDAKNALRRRKEKLNGIELYQRILKRLRRIRRMQDLPEGDSPGPVGSALAPCGATPSGTAFASESGAEQHHIPPTRPLRKVSSF